MQLCETYRTYERLLNGVDVNDDKLDIMVQVETLLNVLVVGQHRVAANIMSHSLYLLRLDNVNQTVLHQFNPFFSVPMLSDG